MPATATETVVIFSCPDEAAMRRKMEDMAVAVCDQARGRGWKACARWDGNGLKLRLQDGDGESVESFLQPFLNRARDQGATLLILKEQESAETICHLDDAGISWGSVVQARLTRDLLCALPEGSYLASVSAENRAASVGRLGPLRVRAQQWQRAQLAGLGGGMCRVFWSGDDYDAFVRLPNESR